MILINEGISQKLLDAVATGTQNSDAFSLPTKATQLTWQTSFGVAPASITVQLQTSLDNLTWNTIDTSTSVGGEDRTIATSALFIRARINAISGGSAITVQLVCKTGFIGLTTPSLVTDGALALFDGTTGSKLKELLFPGGTTTFLRADGTFAAAGGGSAGGSTTQLQYNNASIFDGTSGLVWTAADTKLGFVGLGVPSAATAALIATGTGNIGAGPQTYKITFIDINGNETPAGTTSNSVTTDGSHKQVALSNIPLGPIGTVGRNIYRSDGSIPDQGFWSLTASPTINDNTTTIYTDNIAYTSTINPAPLANGIPGLFAPPAQSINGILFNYGVATATSPNFVYNPTYGTLNSGSLELTATGAGVNPRLLVRGFDSSNVEDPDIVIYGQNGTGLILRYNGTGYAGSTLTDIGGGSTIWATGPGGLTLLTSDNNGLVTGPIRFGTGGYATSNLALTLNTDHSATFASFIEGTEISAPSAPAANGFRIFAVDSGAGKTILKVIFNTGSAQVLATQP